MPFLHCFFINNIGRLLNLYLICRGIVRSKKQMNKLLLCIFFIAPILGFSQNKSFYDFKVTDIHGNTFDFSTLKGKKVLIVNTASECSLAPQLYKLQELYEEYGGDDFEIIAFPCNDFAKHEPGSSQQINDIYTKKYGITFPVMAKIQLKGDSINPVYQWLTSSKENSTLDAKVMWNYQKFLIDKEGYVQDVIWPVGKPKGKRIEEWLLGK